MIIYDDTSLAFCQKCEDMLKDILQGLGFSVRRTRFEYQKYLYPIHVVVFEGSELAHFNAPYFQIAMNRRLIYSAKDSVIRDILRHELAHYLTFIMHGQVQPHGPEFKAVCREFGFSEDVAEATMNLEASNDSKVGDLESDRVLEKVKKLLLLAQSSNAHEAELATVKANALLLRHNLDHLKPGQKDPLYMDRILVQSRKDAKLVAIYEILRHFIVRPVISAGRNTCCLEVSGTLTNVKLARYVGEFLERELVHLWEEARKEHGLQGLRAKNSFYSGVARGFDEKMKRAKVEFSAEDQRSLIVVEKKLDQDIRMIYRRLGSSRSSGLTDGHAQSLGVAKGRDLTIRKGVEGQGKNLYLPRS